MKGGCFGRKTAGKSILPRFIMTSRYYDRPKTELYSIPASGGAPTKLTTIDMDTGSFSLSPDGKTGRLHRLGN
jgi:hypothetical protein